MKVFFSCIDGSISAPQPVQHLVIRECAQKAGGGISFYGAEEVQVLDTQPFIRLKLTRLKSSGLDGVVFYTLHQFRQGPKFNYELLLSILDLDLEVHFAREGVSIMSRNQLKQMFPFFMSVDFTSRRDKSDMWRRFVKETDALALPAHEPHAAGVAG